MRQAFFNSVLKSHINLTAQRLVSANGDNCGNASSCRQMLTTGKAKPERSRLGASVIRTTGANIAIPTQSMWKAIDL